MRRPTVAAALIEPYILPIGSSTCFTFQNQIHLSSSTKNLRSEESAFLELGFLLFIPQCTTSSASRFHQARSAVRQWWTQCVTPRGGVVFHETESTRLSMQAEAAAENNNNIPGIPLLPTLKPSSPKEWTAYILVAAAIQPPLGTLFFPHRLHGFIRQNTIQFHF